eukprot:CAMPEP_0114150274 /NCGR_PEP_ID=MMETSP0043_2-20121206/22616_1 /TAXON_ID=464988 /ORGANISM="Hemiselmis andersenii, Strain CCMP644" /LENGTH=188 /DNA_ID=CAMNT_0001244995 /DNA_START=250 /DNA_END=812 /DNA_ORIENTATION=-
MQPHSPKHSQLPSHNPSPSPARSMPQGPSSTSTTPSSSSRPAGHRRPQEEGSGAKRALFQGSMQSVAGTERLDGGGREQCVQERRLLLMLTEASATPDPAPSVPSDSDGALCAEDSLVGRMRERAAERRGEVAKLLGLLEEDAREVREVAALLARASSHSVDVRALLDAASRQVSHYSRKRHTLASAS